MKTLRYIVLFFFTHFLVFHAFAQQDFTVRKKHFNTDESGLALQAYDVVSYYEQMPVKGKPGLFLYHKGIKYLFATREHLETFKSSPDKYEPAYGGWCAYAMGKKGEKVNVDPLKYKITDGRLYLFYYSIVHNTLNKWNEDEKVLKPSADQNWANLVKH